MLRAPRTRRGAAADALPPDLALEALDAPPGLNWNDVRDAHQSNPWFGYDPHHQPFNLASLERRIGAFRGFGGLFLAPPLVAQSGSHILVRSGDEGWILLADVFGATLHRATSDEIADAVFTAPRPGDSRRLPSGHTCTSTVVLDTTYAMTSGESHSVWIGPATSER